MVTAKVEGDIRPQLDGIARNIAKAQEKAVVQATERLGNQARQRIEAETGLSSSRTARRVLDYPDTGNLYFGNYRISAEDYDLQLTPIPGNHRSGVSVGGQSIPGAFAVPPRNRPLIIPPGQNRPIPLTIDPTPAFTRARNQAQKDAPGILKEEIEALL